MNASAAGWRPSNAGPDYPLGSLAAAPAESAAAEPTESWEPCSNAGPDYPLMPRPRAGAVPAADPFIAGLYLG